MSCRVSGQTGRLLTYVAAVVSIVFAITTSRSENTSTPVPTEEIQQQTQLDIVSGIQHIIWIWFENKEASQITAASAPYFTSFATNNVNLTNFYGVTHPSEPNYLDAFSGSNQGVIDDGSYTFPASTDNLAKQLTTAGKSWRVYAQDFPGACYNGTSFTGG